MSDTRREYGVICDRLTKGLGKALLSTGPTIASAEHQAVGRCVFGDDHHPHLIVWRNVTRTEWSDPIAGMTAPIPSESPRDNTEGA
jgi:hypothetical protein